MTNIDPVVDRFWTQRFDGADALVVTPDLTITVDPALPASRRLMVLELADGPTRVVATPELADLLDLERCDSVLAVTDRLAELGGALNGADLLHYLPAATMPDQRDGFTVRRLGPGDADAFAEFTAASTPDDLDEAFVELDHWLVFGAFDGDRLVSAASMYPWSDAPDLEIADVGVLTLGSSRGRGFADAAVRAISRAACERSFHPQYRCQLDNTASRRLAERAGFVAYGTWDVIDSDSPV